MRYAFYVTLIFALLLTTGTTAWSQQTFTPSELDELLGPIALYPDPLLAQILPAATYPDQLNSAYELVQFQGGSGMIDDQAWDVSVKAVAHYPDVLKMMVTSPDWTISIGQAYVNQPQGVMNSIQRLRGRAQLMGYLNSNSYQSVSVSGSYISIVPAQAQYIYVPAYDPQVVYVRHRPFYSTPLFAFGAGLLIGAWLNNAIDWDRHRVYYHGWNGGGWVGRSRPRIQYNNPYYVNRSWGNRAAPINRDIRTRDITNYRQGVKRNAGKFVPPALTAPVGPNVSTPSPTPRTRRPSNPTVRPSPALPTTRPSTGTGVPATKHDRIVPRPVTPAVPGAGPMMPRTRPGTMPAMRVPRTVTPSTSSLPTARPNPPSAIRAHKPAVSAPPTLTPTAPRVPSAKSNTRPAVSAPRTVTPTAPRAPSVRSSTRSSGGGAAIRTAPSATPASPRTAPNPKGGKDKNGNKRGGDG